MLLLLLSTHCYSSCNNGARFILLLLLTHCYSSCNNGARFTLLLLLTHCYSVRAALFKAGLSNAQTGGPITEYTGTGPNAGRYTVSHKWATDYQQVVQQLTLLRGSGVKVVYLGLPLLHMLYDPDWGAPLPVCDSGFDMRAASHGMLDAVQLEAGRQGIMVLLGTGNSHLPNEEASMVTRLNTPTVAQEWCKVCFQNQRCEEFSQSVSGMVAANGIVIEALRDPKYDRIKLMRFDQITQFRVPENGVNMYRGGGHYSAPVTDQKVALLLSTASTAYQQPRDARSESPAVCSASIFKSIATSVYQQEQSMTRSEFDRMCSTVAEQPTLEPTPMPPSAPPTTPPPTTGPTNLPTNAFDPTPSPTQQSSSNSGATETTDTGDSSGAFWTAPIADAIIEPPMPRHVKTSRRMAGYNASTDLGALQWLANQGLALIGDSPVGQLYVRLVNHLEGMTNEVTTLAHPR